jgi:hypothetical protein
VWQEIALWLSSEPSINSVAQERAAAFYRAAGFLRKISS